MRLSRDIAPGPEEAPLREDLAADLEATGTKRDEADWLADQVVLAACQWADRASPPADRDRSADTTARRAVAHMEPLLTRNLSRSARVVGALYRLAELRAYTDPSGATESDEQEVFERAMRAACSISPPIQFDGGLEELLPEERRADLDLIAFKVLKEAQRLPASCEENLALPESAHLRQFRSMVERATDDEVGHVAWSAMEPLRPRPPEEKRDYPSPGLGQQDLSVWLALLEERLARRPDDARLRGSLWVAILRADMQLVDDESRRRWLDLAQRRVAFLRKDDQTCSDHRGPPWEGYAEHDRDALHVIARLGGEWKAVKAALLLLRALRNPAVSMDLRYKLEKRDHEGRHPDAPPVERRWIAETIATLLHQYASEKAEQDPQLEAFRSEFAKYCLDRLKSRYEFSALPSNPDACMLEYMPDWRRGYIRAVRELRVNPFGKGHQVLYWLSHNDPHESLRGEAATAYGEMIRDTKLAASPHRALFAAFWHLRMAHAQALRGDRVDAVGAKRTRQRETNYIKKLEGNRP